MGNGGRSLARLLPRAVLLRTFIPGLACRAETLAAKPAEYEIKIDSDERVRMRDGIELSADVCRPSADGQFRSFLRAHLTTRVRNVAQ
jgi:predicted acyl esterase